MDDLAQQRLDELLGGLFSEEEAQTDSDEAGPPPPIVSKEEAPQLFRLFSDTGVQVIDTTLTTGVDYSALAQRPKRLESAFDPEEEERIAQEAARCVVTIDDVVAEAALYHRHQGKHVMVIKQRKKTRRGGKRQAERLQKHQRDKRARPYFDLDRADQPVSKKRAKKKASLEKLKRKLKAKKAAK